MPTKGLCNTNFTVLIFLTNKQVGDAFISCITVPLHEVSVDLKLVSAQFLNTSLVEGLVQGVFKAPLKEGAVQLWSFLILRAMEAHALF